MSYISLLIAYFQTRKSGLTDSAWLDKFFDNLVGVETWFYHASWYIWAVLVILGVIGVIWMAKEFGKEAVFGLGCFVIFGGIIILAYPFFEWATMQLAIGMAESVNATTGIVNSNQFWFSAFLYALIGTG